MKTTRRMFFVGVIIAALILTGVFSIKKANSFADQLETEKTLRLKDCQTIVNLQNDKTKLKEEKDLLKLERDAFCQDLTEKGKQLYRLNWLKIQAEKARDEAEKKLKEIEKPKTQKSKSTPALIKTPQAKNTNKERRGVASWYSWKGGGNYAACRFIPKGTKVTVTNAETGKSVQVTINDFGPSEHLYTVHNRIIDLQKEPFVFLFGGTGRGLGSVIIRW